MSKKSSKHPFWKQCSTWYRFLSRFVDSTQLTFSLSVPIYLSYCCQCCAPCTIVFCCNICNLGHFIFSTTELSRKPVCKKKLHMPKEYTQGPVEESLCAALIAMHWQLTVDLFGEGTFLPPQALMANTLVDCIVNLAHDQVLKTTKDLQQQVSWECIDSHGSMILDLVHRFCPLPTTSTLFTTTPLAFGGQAPVSNTASATAAAPAAKTQQKCKGCGVPGHYCMFLLYFF